MADSTDDDLLELVAAGCTLPIAKVVTHLILSSDWLAEHDRQVAEKALTAAADEILRRRALVQSSGSTRADETWDNGNMSAEAIVRSQASNVVERES